MKNYDKKLEHLTSSGDRLKYIRYLAKLSRQGVSDKLEVPVSTLKSWEQSDIISEKRLKLYIKALKSIGIICDLEWIKTGFGNEPVDLSQLNNSTTSEDTFDINYLKLLNTKKDIFISYINKEEKFLFINDKYEEVFNLPSQEIVGKKLNELIGKQGYKVCKPFIDRALKGEHVTFEYPWKYENKSYRYLRLSYIPNITSYNEILGFFSFIEDKDPFTEQDTLHEGEEESKAASYDHTLYIKTLTIVTKILAKKSKLLNLYHVSTLTYHAYCYFIKIGKVDRYFVESLADRLNFDYSN